MHTWSGAFCLATPVCAVTVFHYLQLTASRQVTRNALRDTRPLKKLLTTMRLTEVDPRAVDTGTQEPQAAQGDEQYQNGALKSIQPQQMRSLCRRDCLPHKPAHTLANQSGLLQEVVGSEASDRKILSERERQVLKLVAEGFSSREIASRIYVSTKTVETYRGRFAEKLGLKTRADVVQYALNAGLLSAEKFSFSRRPNSYSVSNDNQKSRVKRKTKN